MADLTYRVNVETQNAQQSLNTLKTALGTLAAAFSVRAIVQFGDGITNLQNKLRTISQDSEDVARQLAAIGQIADRNRTSLTATGDLFFKIARSLDVLGISQQDAAVLTDSISKGLTLSGASAEGAASAIYQLGQAFGANVLRGEELNAVLENAPVLTTVLAKSLGVTVGELRKLGEQGKLTGEVVSQAFIKANAELTESFSKTVPTVAQSLERLRTNLGTLFVNVGGGEALGTLADAVGRVADAMQPLSQFIKANGDALATLAKVVGGVVAGYLIFARILPAVAAAQNALFLALGRGGSAFNTLKNAVIGTVVGIKNFALNLGKSVGILSGAFNSLQYATAAAGALLKVFLRFAGIVGIVYAVAEGVDFLLKKLGVNFSILGTLSSAFEFLKGKLFGTSEAQKETARTTEDAIKQLDTQVNVTKSLVKITDEQSRAIRSTVRGYQENAEAQLASLRVSNQLMSASEEQRNLTQALQTAEENYYSTVRDLSEQLAKAKLEAAGKESEAVNQITSELGRLDQAYLANGQIIRDLIVQQETLTRARDLEQFAVKQQQTNADALLKLQREMADIGLSGIEKKYRDIERASEDAARAAIRSEEQRRGGIKLSQAEIEAYQQAARAGNEELIRLSEELFRSSRTFESGWNEAFREFADNATNAAKQAEQVFGRLTRGLEDAFVNFAKTGRLSFRDMINGIVEDLLRSQIRQVLAQVLGGGGGRSSGGGGVLGSIGKIFGFASGGVVPGNRPILVGEQGPEIFMPPGQGTVIPNNQMGGAMVINYNISAVDARSFQELVARDPEFIYAVTERGRRGLPQGRR